ncbi:MAG: lyase, partial [Acidimicrobiia bacterium]
TWDTWHLPGNAPETYAVFVDDTDIVWASDFGSNSMVRFDPNTEEFHTYVLPHDPGNVRQILGRPGEVWFPESAADNLIVIRTTN